MICLRESVDEEIVGSMIGRSFFFDVGELLERGRSNDLQKNEFIFKTDLRQSGKMHTPNI